MKLSVRSCSRLDYSFPLPHTRDCCEGEEGLYKWKMIWWAHTCGRKDNRRVCVWEKAEKKHWKRVWKGGSVCSKKKKKKHMRNQASGPRFPLSSEWVWKRAADKCVNYSSWLWLFNSGSLLFIGTLSISFLLRDCLPWIHHCSLFHTIPHPRGIVGTPGKSPHLPVWTLLSPSFSSNTAWAEHWFKPILSTFCGVYNY